MSEHDWRQGIVTLRELQTMTFDEHKLTVTFPGSHNNYSGECSCGWTCRRSRERDVWREHRKHSADADKLTVEQWRNREQEKTS